MQDLRMCVHMYVYMCMSLCWVTIKSLSYMYLLHERFHKFLFLLFIIIRVPLRVQTLTPIHALTHKQTNKKECSNEETLYRCFWVFDVYMCTHNHECVLMTPPYKRTMKERRNERWTTGSEKRASPSLSVIRIITGEVQLLINIYSCLLAAFTAYVVVVLVIVALQKWRDFEYDLIFQDQQKNIFRDIVIYIIQPSARNKAGNNDE